MASYGAPPSSLIIMNLLATSVFTHYNKVSTIKHLDVTPPKVNSANIDDTFSGKNKRIIGDKYDVDPVEKLRTNEIDIKPNNENQNVDFKDGIQENKGTSGAKSNNFKGSLKGKEIELPNVSTKQVTYTK
ncbi:MAG: hypothetical protein RR646_06875 [Erysipelotrichaceae bacterium]